MMDEQPFAHTVLQLDTAASSDGTRARQVHLDKALEKVLAGAKQRCPFVDDTWFHRVTGDSAVIAAPATVPKALIASDFVRELLTALHNFNSMMNEAGRLRVRLAVDHGDVVRHSGFINGSPVVRAARLCDSESLRDALRRNNDVDLAVVFTETFYDDAVIEGDRRLDASEFTFVHDRVKGREVSGWMWLPGRRKPVAASTAPPVPAGDAHGGSSQNFGVVTTHGPAVFGRGVHQVNNYGGETPRARREAEGGAADDR